MMRCNDVQAAAAEDTLLAKTCELITVAAAARETQG